MTDICQYSSFKVSTYISSTSSSMFTHDSEASGPGARCSTPTMDSESVDLEAPSQPSSMLIMVRKHHACCRAAREQHADFEVGKNDSLVWRSANCLA